jgi:serine/threonine protein kinase
MFVNRELGSHPNIVKVVKSFSMPFKGEMRHVLIMPPFPRSCADLKALGTCLSRDTLKMIAQDCFNALCHIHDNDFIYCDLKHSNIMLSGGENGQICSS